MRIGGMIGRGDDTGAGRPWVPGELPPSEWIAEPAAPARRKINWFLVAYVGLWLVSLASAAMWAVLWSPHTSRLLTGQQWTQLVFLIIGLLGLSFCCGDNLALGMVVFAIVAAAIRYWLTGSVW